MKYEEDRRNSEEREDDCVAEFSTLEEAEALANQCNVGNESHWLCRHTPLVPEVVKLIRQFGDPKQVLFFHPGDLVLCSIWDDSPERVDTCCILCRRQEVS